MTQREPDPLLGSVLAGKYRVARALGTGGMATVYEAAHVELGKRVAVKVIHPQTASSPAMVERFMREARASAMIESPFICQVHDVGRLDDGRPFLVMDLLQGRSLFEQMQRTGRMDPAGVVTIIAQVCRGLALAHDAGLIHRDLKPENIFLSESPDGEQRAVLLDFGLVGFYGERGRNENMRLTRDGSLFGTPLYMSPEQIEGFHELEPRSDLWSLACIVFECITGQPLWDEKQGLTKVLTQILFDPRPVPSQVCSDLPPSFDDWFAKATSAEPAMRFSDARSFAVSLGESLGVPVHASLAETGTVMLTPLRAGQTEIEQAPTERPPTHGTLASVERAPRDSHLAHNVPKIVSIGALGVVLAGIAFGLPLALRDKDASMSVQRTDAANAILAVVEAKRATPKPSASAGPVASDACEAVLHASQRFLEEAKIGEAISALSSAGEGSDCPAANGMVAHLRIAAAAEDGCTLSGLVRPRPSSAANAARHATVYADGDGAAVSWVEQGKQEEQLWAARLGTSWIASGRFELAQSERIVSVTSDGASPTVLYALGKDGSEGLWASRIEGERTSKPVRWLDRGHHASVVRLGEATLVIAPADTADASRNLTATWAPSRPGIAAAVLTGFAGSYGPVGPRVSGPRALVRDGQLLLAYRLERGSEHDIMFQRVSTERIASGGDPLAPDAVLGEVHRLTHTKWRVYSPAMDCSAGACLVAWRGMPRGVTAVLVDAHTGRERWRTVVSPRGGNVGVGLSDRGDGVVAWYESGRLWTARADRDGLSDRTPVAAARGEHESPVVASSGQQWWVAWTTFEAGHPEPYVARVRCAVE